MDFVEINKYIQKSKVSEAELHLYEPKDLTKEESLRLLLNACKKEYGIVKTVKIVHGFGIKKL